MGVMGTHQVFDSVNDLGQAIGIEAVTRRNGVVGVVGFPAESDWGRACQIACVRTGFVL